MSGNGKKVSNPDEKKYWLVWLGWDYLQVGFYIYIYLEHGDIIIYLYVYRYLEILNFYFKAFDLAYEKNIMINLLTYL